MIDFIELLQKRILEGLAPPFFFASLSASVKAFVSQIEFTSFAGHILFQRNISSVLKVLVDEMINSHLFFHFLQVLALNKNPFPNLRFSIQRWNFFLH